MRTNLQYRNDLTCCDMMQNYYAALNRTAERNLPEKPGKEHGLRKAVLHADGESCAAAAVAAIFSPVPAALKLSNPPVRLAAFLNSMKQPYSDAFLVKMSGILRYMDLDDLFRTAQNL